MRCHDNSVIVVGQLRSREVALFDSPEDAEMAFYVAIENRDVDAMMDVWSGSDDVVCIHPGAPRLEGREIIADSWQQIFESGESLRFRLTDLRCLREERLSVHTVREEIEIDGEVVDIMLTTNIFACTDQGWHLILHHASAEPDFDDDAEDSFSTLDNSPPDGSVTLH